MKSQTVNRLITLNAVVLSVLGVSLVFQFVQMSLISTTQNLPEEGISLLDKSSLDSAYRADVATDSGNSNPDEIFRATSDGLVTPSANEFYDDSVPDSNEPSRSNPNSFGDINTTDTDSNSNPSIPYNQAGMPAQISPTPFVQSPSPTPVSQLVNEEIRTQECGLKDINADGKVTMTDIEAFVGILTEDAPCDDSKLIIPSTDTCGKIDINNNGRIDEVDIVDFGDLFSFTGSDDCATLRETAQYTP